MTRKRKLSDDQHGFLTSSKRLKMSTSTDEIADASTTHQILSSRDTGMYSTVMNCCHDP